MRDFFKILSKLSEKQIHYCFQSHGISKFYNLSVKDSKKIEHNFHDESLDVLEIKLKVLWGHLLEKGKGPIGLPVPPGFPAP